MNGAYFIDENLTSDIHLELFQHQVIPILKTLYTHRGNVWFQQVGAPAHYGRQLREYLNDTFANHWIDRRGEIRLSF